MNFNFTSAFSMNANGGMIIRNADQQITISGSGITINNGGQKITLGSGGTRIQQSGQNIVMNNRGIYIDSYSTAPRYNTSSNISGMNNFDEDSINQSEESFDFDDTFSSDDYENSFSILETEVGFNYQGSSINQNNQSQRQANVYINQGIRNVYGDYYQQNIEVPPERPPQVGLKKTQINTIPLQVYKKPVSVKINSKGERIDPISQEPSSNNTCAICIGDYKGGEQLRSLKCKHKFHKDCIDKWLQLKNECPICKKRIV